MKHHLLVIVGLASISLSACDHYSTKLAALEKQQIAPSYYNDVNEIAPAAGLDMTFKDYLINEYITLAEYENDTKRDYRAAKYYTDKIDMLEQGYLVGPASLSGFDLAEADKMELDTAREYLVNALHTFTIPKNRYSLAMAQTHFDCWVDQAEERQAENQDLSCRADFDNAMVSLVVPEEFWSELDNIQPAAGDIYQPTSGISRPSSLY